MAISKTDIANQALGLIGAARIDDIDDPDTKNARVCKNCYEQTVREVARSAEWNVLKDRAELAADPVAPAFGWAYRYHVPANFIKLVKLNGTAEDNDPGDEYELEGSYLLTNAETARIQFLGYQEGNVEWTRDSLFVDAVVTLLASKIATPIKVDGGEMAGALFGRYEQIKLPKAARKDGAERKRRRYDVASESRWVAARRFSTNG